MSLKALVLAAVCIVLLLIAAAKAATRRLVEGRAETGVAVDPGAPAGAGTFQTGIAAKKPVFGGACKICPWGAMAEAVQPEPPLSWKSAACRGGKNN